MNLTTLSVFFSGLLVLNSGASAAEPTSAPVSVIEARMTLEDLEARMAKLSGDFAGRVSFMEDVARFVEKNTLASGDEFLRASRLMGLLGGFDFQFERVRYELLLAAIAKDERPAEAGLVAGWNAFLRTLGRPGRINLPARADTDNEPPPVPAPVCVAAVYRDPGAAREAAKAATDHVEIKAIVDADQAVRKSDWSKLTAEERKAISDGDHARIARIRVLVAEGAPRTAGDFSRASLVMQHSASFSGYQLAHELAVCTLLLGDRQRGRWLVAATYDRMLGSVGQAQRFGTQFRGNGLMRIEENGICDAQRIALGCPTLARARSRQLGGSADERKVTALTTQAAALKKERRFAEAAKLEQQAVALMREGGDGQTVGGMLSNLARTLGEAGDSVDAERVAREALAMLRKDAPAGSWTISVAQFGVGRSLLAQKRYTEAEVELVAAYERLREAKNSTPEDMKRRVIRAEVGGLVELYQVAGREKEAEFWRVRMEVESEVKP